MVFGGNQSAASDIASLIGWWQEAGLDVLVDEEPRDWLAKVEPVAPIVVPAAQQAPATQAFAQPAPPSNHAPERPAPMAEAPRPAPGRSLPDTLAGFQAWLASTDKLSIPLGARLGPSGDPASGLMVLVDLPEAVDIETGRLLSGPMGELFDKMISAMKRDRSALYLSSMAPGRPSGGYVDPASGALFSELARHHVALAKPRALLLMGEAPSRAFLGKGFVEARGSVHDVKLGDGAVSAVATFHPRTLLQHPQQKRRAWEDLQLLMQLLG